MRYTTYTFQGYKGRAGYTCPCDTCGKTLKRTAVVENTVNPYNKNEDGSVRTPIEVMRRAQTAAEQEAAKLQGVPVTCRDCEDAPYRAFLLKMAAEPEKSIRDDREISGLVRTGTDRGHLDYDRDDPKCWEGIWSTYKLTPKGLKRAAQLQP